MDINTKMWSHTKILHTQNVSYLKSSYGDLDILENCDVHIKCYKCTKFSFGKMDLVVVLITIICDKKLLYKNLMTHEEMNV